MELADQAYELLKKFPQYLEDAREGAHVNNTVVGGVLAVNTGSARWATENAVKIALRRIQDERKKGERKKGEDAE